MAGSAYTTRAAIKSILERGRVNAGIPALSDAQIDTDIGTASQLINAHCYRHFDLVAETRTYDAPAATHLDIPDLQPSPAAAVVLGGVPLVAGTDYLLEPQITVLHPAYQQIVRVQSGFIRRWGYTAVARANVVSVPISRGGIYDEYLSPATPYMLAAPSASEQQVQITGTWGYAATVPAPVVQATEMLTIRLAVSRSQLYTGQSGTSLQGNVRQLPLLLTPDVTELLSYYVRLDTPEANSE